MLLFMRANPEAANLPLDYAGTFVNGQYVPDPRQGFSDLFGASLSEKDDEEAGGMTGFMWGWAFNAARRICELPPAANPAIVTIG
jgi:hypothetical protein